MKVSKKTIVTLSLITLIFSILIFIHEIFPTLQLTWRVTITYLGSFISVSIMMYSIVSIMGLEGKLTSDSEIDDTRRYVGSLIASTIASMFIISREEFIHIEERISPYTSYEVLVVDDEPIENILDEYSISDYNGIVVLSNKIDREFDPTTGGGEHAIGFKNLPFGGGVVHLIEYSSIVDESIIDDGTVLVHSELEDWPYRSAKREAEDYNS